MNLANAADAWREHRALPPAMLLDLDDTILDIQASADVCWGVICAEVQRDLGAPGAELHRTILETRAWFWSDPVRAQAGRFDLGAASRTIVERALASLGAGDSATADRLADAFRERRDAFVAPLPGALATLGELRRRGLRLALLTNGAAAVQRSKIQRFELAKYFDCILVEGECGFGKPDERIYRRALDALRVSGPSIWSVGDNLEWDVAGPQRLGAYAVWVDHRAAGLPPGSAIRPDRVIQSLAELL